MKIIKLKICGADLNDKFSFGIYFLNILKKYYKVELTEKADYVLYGESTYDYLNYEGIRIFFTGENISPDFNLCDYAVGFDYLNFQDRYFRMPLYLITQFYSDEEIAMAGDRDFTRQKMFTLEDLQKKTSFCSFVYSNYLAGGQREEILNKLSKYKKVDSGGKYLNNIGGPVKNKLAFEMQHKFAIAFENSSRSGYTTEKLVNALVARTIPIYWGNPDIAIEFNSKRFVNCHDYKNFDQVVEKVKELDKNDNLYLQVINQPIEAPGINFNLYQENLEKFLVNIFDQPLSQAKRRTINAARAAVIKEREKLFFYALKKRYLFQKILAAFYKPFKKLAFLEKIKQKYFSRKLSN